MSTGKQRICIICHIHYPELWREIRKYLGNLLKYSDFDLFVTLTEKSQHMQEEIISSFDNKKERNRGYIKNISLVTNNNGADILPFIETINKINLDNYDLVYKIHTKRNLPELFDTPANINKKFYIGKMLWRNFLLSAILGKKTTKKVLLAFKNKKNGSVGFKPLIASFDTKKSSMPLLAERTGVQNIQNYHFFAGTIFAIRAHILKPLQNKFEKKDFIDKNGKFPLLCYRLEHFLGYLTESAGYNYTDINPFSNQKILEFLSRPRLLFLYKFYVNNFIFGEQVL